MCVNINTYACTVAWFSCRYLELKTKENQDHHDVLAIIFETKCNNDDLIFHIIKKGEGMYFLKYFFRKSPPKNSWNENFFFLGLCLLMIRLAAMDPISINFLERKWNSRHSCRSPVPTTRNAPTAINASSTIQTGWPTKKVSRRSWSLNPPNVSMRCELEKFTHAIHHQVCIYIKINSCCNFTKKN